MAKTVVGARKLFLIAMLLQAILPLAPIFVAFVNHHALSDALLAGTIPLYIMGLGASARDPLLMLLTLVGGIFVLFAAGSGFDSDPSQFKLGAPARFFTEAAGLASFLGFGYDRWTVHVSDGEPFGMWASKD